MSLHVNTLLVHVETPEKSYETFVNKLGIGNAMFREKLAFDDAIDSLMDVDQGVAIACAEGWTSVWGAELSMIVGEKELAEVSRPTKAYYFTLDGRSQTYFFEAYSNGERKRKRAYQDGEVFIEEGTPLPEELAGFKEDKDEEDRAFGLMNKLSIPHRRLTKPKFHVFDLEE